MTYKHFANLKELLSVDIISTYFRSVERVSFSETMEEDAQISTETKLFGTTYSSSVDCNSNRKGNINNEVPNPRLLLQKFLSGMNQDFTESTATKQARNKVKWEESLITLDKVKLIVDKWQNLMEHFVEYKKMAETLSDSIV